MNALRYLPSTQFLVIVGSILLSGGLVLAAERFTRDQYIPGKIMSGVPAQPPADPNWQNTLNSIQGVSQAPDLTPPNPETVGSLLDAAKSSNLTTTVGRSLLINISAAKSQGLGSDIPTQDQVVAQARAQIESTQSAPQYKNADLALSAQNAAALKAYGNGVIAVLAAHPKANYEDTVVAVGKATDSNTASALAALPGIQAEYKAVVRELLALPVPPNMAPLHLKVVNDFSILAASYDDMAQTLSDPLRGVAGLSIYDSTTDEIGRVFINIAQTFSQNGILFTEDEPGSSWSALVQS
ncbi:MAG TPA: hypothetical protein VHD55_02170 [Candidatus Paceibacterota bacterium]|nr:hypothetical protein [Candidatus Paceibacterota bacterium]